MTSLTTSAPEQPLFMRLRFLNERTTFALGVGLFLLILLLSVATRIYLESRFGALSVPMSTAASKNRTLAKGDILVPVTLSAKLHDGRVVLRGTLPTEDAHQTVLARAQALYGAENVEDNLDVQPDIVVTPWFDSVLRWFPGRVDDLRNGEISVSGMNVFLFGEVSSVSVRTAAQQNFNKLVGAEGHLSNGLQVSYGADSSPTSPVVVTGATNKNTRAKKPANFEVQF